MTNPNSRITVYYDGACPVCVRDRQQFEQWAGNHREEVRWFDITGREAELQSLGIDPRRALTELHLRDGQGLIRSELDAYIILLNLVPRLRPLAWLIGLPVIRPLLARIYRWSVRRRLRAAGRLPGDIP